MHLFNVRRGQFVYYNNILHKVYSVKPFFKRSVHLIRLHDYEQQLATAREIDLYKPKHMDAFTYNNQRYTLNKDKKANIGDYILVINPRPDSLDHHHLHAMEIVSSVETNGVISNKLNGIKHSEYWVMVSGIEAGANVIDRLHHEGTDADNTAESTSDPIIPEAYIPRIGDVYQRTDPDHPLQTIVVAIEGETIYLGGGIKVSIHDLEKQDQWEFLHYLWEQ